MFPGSRAVKLLDLAEVVRGSLRAIPRGQEEEAGEALGGFGYWQRKWSIVLPQALWIVIPPLVKASSHDHNEGHLSDGMPAGIP